MKEVLPPAPNYISIAAYSSISHKHISQLSWFIDTGSFLLILSQFWDLLPATASTCFMVTRCLPASSSGPLEHMLKKKVHNQLRSTSWFTSVHTFLGQRFEWSELQRKAMPSTKPDRDRMGLLKAFALVFSQLTQFWQMCRCSLVIHLWPLSGLLWRTSWRWLSRETVFGLSQKRGHSDSKSAKISRWRQGAHSRCGFTSFRLTYSCNQPLNGLFNMLLFWRCHPVWISHSSTLGRRGWLKSAFAWPACLLSI